MSSTTIEQINQTVEELFARLPELRAVRSPIYIPSRGRAETAIVPGLLDSAELPYTMVVEPNDYSAYCNRFGKDNVLRIDANDQGLAYSRNTILRDARERGYHRVWQLDDNIKSFRARINSRNIVTSPRHCFALIETVTNGILNFGAAGLNASVFAFSYDGKHGVQINRQVCSAMLVNTDTGLWFRSGVIEDTDFSLQLLRSGWSTLLFRRLCYDKPPTMSMSGGCTDVQYRDGNNYKFLRRLQELWPEAKFRIVDKHPRPAMAPSRIWMSYHHQPLWRPERIKALDAGMGRSGNCR